MKVDPSHTYREVFAHSGLTLPPYWDRDYLPFRAEGFFQWTDTIQSTIPKGNTIQLRQRPAE
jgi:hypothetical protein